VAGLGGSASQGFGVQYVEGSAIERAAGTGAGFAPDGWTVVSGSPDMNDASNGAWGGATGVYTLQNVNGTSSNGGKFAELVGTNSPTVNESIGTTLTGLVAGQSYSYGVQWQQATLNGNGFTYASGGQLKLTINGTSQVFTSTGLTDGWQTAVMSFIATGTSASIVVAPNATVGMDTSTSAFNAFIVVDSLSTQQMGGLATNGTAAADVIVGTDGSETFNIATAATTTATGTDKVIAGAGNDTVIFNSFNAGVMTVDGGSGVNFLQFTQPVSPFGANMTLDLTDADVRARITNFSSIDITGQYANTINLDYAAVMNMSGATNVIGTPSDESKMFVVSGNNTSSTYQDKLKLVNLSAWSVGTSQTSESLTATYGSAFKFLQGHTYKSYTLNGATLFVDDFLDVTNLASSTTPTPRAYSQAVTIESLFGPQNGSTDTAFSFTDANTAGTANATFKGVALTNIGTATDITSKGFYQLSKDGGATWIDLKTVITGDTVDIYADKAALIRYAGATGVEAITPQDLTARLVDNSGLTGSGTYNLAATGTTINASVNGGGTAFSGGNSGGVGDTVTINLLNRAPVSSDADGIVVVDAFGAAEIGSFASASVAAINAAATTIFGTTTLTVSGATGTIAGVIGRDTVAETVTYTYSAAVKSVTITLRDIDNYGSYYDNISIFVNGQPYKLSASNILTTTRVFEQPASASIAADGYSFTGLIADGNNTFNSTITIDASDVPGGISSLAVKSTPVGLATANPNGVFVNVAATGGPAATAAQSVEALFGPTYTDADFDTMRGVTITSAGTTSDLSSLGKYQYQIAGTTTWVDMPAGLSDTGAVFLAKADLIRFVPSSTNTSLVNKQDLTARLVDDSAATAPASGSTVNVSVNGGSTPYSGNAITLQTPAAGAPVNSVPGTQSASEDTQLAISGLSVTDPDGNLASTQLSVQNGTLNVTVASGASISAGTNDSGTLTISGTQSAINTTLASLKYQGVLNYNGTDLLSVVSKDSTNISSGTSTVTINVAPVNDQPTVTSNGQFAARNTGLEDQGAPTNSTFGQTVASVEGMTGRDVDGDSVGVAFVSPLQSTTFGTAWYSLNNGTTWLNLTTKLATASETNAFLLDASARVYFEGNANLAGTLGKATIRTWDGTDGAFSGTYKNISALQGPSGAYSAATGLFNMVVNQVNDAPNVTLTTLSPTYSGSAANVFSNASVNMGPGESTQNLIQFKMTAFGLKDGANERLTIDGTTITLTAGTSGTTTNGWTYALTSSAADNVFLTVSHPTGKDVATMNALFNSMTYTNTAATRTTGTRSFRLDSIQDDGGTENGGVDSKGSLALVGTVNVPVVDDVAPTLVSTSPADNGQVAFASAANDLTLTFSEAVKKGTGTIQLFKADNTLVESFDAATSGLVSGWGTSTLTINPTASLLAGTGYYVKIAATAVTDLAGNAYAGTAADNSTFNFTVLNSDGSIPVLPPYGGQTSSSLGYSVSSAGDVNGDGYDDMIVGAFGTSSGDGAAYVVYGNAAGTGVDLSSGTIAQSLGFKISSQSGSNIRLGQHVSSAGDINGDGYADVIVGAQQGGASGTNAGSAYVIYGKSTNAGVALPSGTIASSDGFMFSGAASSFLGSSVSSAGDVNGDGLADLIIGAYGANNFNGSAYVVYGNTAGIWPSLTSDTIAASQGFKISADGWFGYNKNVSAAGDVNGDGLADVIVGEGISNDAYVVYGNSTGTGVDLIATGGSIASSLGFRITAQTVANYAMSVSSAGDVNGDGFADVIVGTSNINNYAGTTFVVYGGSAGASVNFSSGNIAANQGFKIIGEANSYLGSEVASAGDVNGDGLSDLIVSARVQNDAYVVYGKTTGSTLDLSSGIISGSDGFKLNGVVSGQFGGSVSSAGDINGDGLGDLIIGAPTTNSNAGAYYIVLGGTNTVTNAVNLTGTSSGEAVLGTAGNDVLTGNGGVDRFYSGKGNDTIVLQASDVTNLSATTGATRALVSGGNGFDTVRLNGTNLDLTTISNVGAMGLEENSRIESIERIDMATDAGANTLSIAAKDVNDMADFNSIRLGASDDGKTWSNVTGTALSATTRFHQVVVDGTGADTLNLGAGFTQVGTVSNGTATYNVYQNTATNSQVIADSAITNVVMDLAPTLVSTSPVDNSNVAFADAGNNLSLTFNEVVTKGTGLIQLYNASTNALVESFDAASSSLVTGWGTSTLTINPSANLLGATGYYVKVAPTAVQDLGGNAYAGITDTTTFNFGVLGSDGSIPVVPPYGGQPSSQLGRSVSSAGDVNGDGYEDMIVGAAGCQRRWLCRCDCQCPQHQQQHWRQLCGLRKGCEHWIEPEQWHDCGKRWFFPHGSSGK
jgi:methionine-rich copper-binding protein CopC